MIISWDDGTSIVLDDKDTDKPYLIITDKYSRTIETRIHMKEKFAEHIVSQILDTAMNNKPTRIVKVWS